MRTIALISIALTILTGCVGSRDGAAADLPTVPVDASFATRDGSWGGGALGRFGYAWTVKQMGGRPMLCGAYYTTNARTTSAARNMLRGAVVSGSAGPVIRNLSYFANRRGARRVEDLDGQPARCTPLPDGTNASDPLSVDLGSSVAHL